MVAGADGLLVVFEFPKEKPVDDIAPELDPAPDPAPNVKPWLPIEPSGADDFASFGVEVTDDLLLFLLASLS